MENCISVMTHMLAAFEYNFTVFYGIKILQTNIGYITLPRIRRTVYLIG